MSLAEYNSSMDSTDMIFVSLWDITPGILQYLLCIYHILVFFFYYFCLTVPGAICKSVHSIFSADYYFIKKNCLCLEEAVSLHWCFLNICDLAWQKGTYSLTSCDYNFTITRVISLADYSTMMLLSEVQISLP